MDKNRIGYVLFFVGLCLLLILGGWQVVRGLEKAEIAVLSEAPSDASMIREAPDDWQSLNYRSVELVGMMSLGKDFLLQNRLYKGRPGYEVLTPFYLSDGTVLLVNRGWVPLDGLDVRKIGRRYFGGLAKGQLYLPQKGFTLGETYNPPVEWPLKILYYDFDALSEVSGLTLAPAVLVLDSDDVYSFERIWQPATIAPARHYGYAVQWFGLALTLLIFGFIWRRRALR